MLNLENVRKSLIRIAALALFSLAFFASVSAQQPRSVTIRVVPDRVLIEGTLPARSAWSFRDSYAGVLGLGNRIENLKLVDGKGIEIQTRKIAPGQFESASAASKFSYEVKLTPGARSSEAALVSWLTSEHGVLMLGDLLPSLDLPARLAIRIEVPTGWTVSSPDKVSLQNEFEITDPDRAVILVGKNLRLSARTPAGARLVLATDNEWAFKDDEAIDLAGRILKAHSDLAGRVPCSQAALFMLPFPGPAPLDRWSAQTRGCAVVLLMGKQPSRVGALSQLGNALTHEIFHLWIPNGVALQGDYDWFYEGFTVYHAARTAVHMDLLTFTDFMAAIGRAYDGVTGATDLNNLSLIEASKRRWTTGSSGVYAKAMLMAFLIDLDLRSRSKGKRSLNDVYREMFRSPKTGDGNAVVTEVISQVDGRLPIQKLISGPYTIDLQKELAPYGLRVEKFGFRTRIVPNEKLTKPQRDLLRELGYNEPRKR
ncbi:MAG TPA: hypothetical protein VJT71_08220 [Pyrinomonadaceae bacterium]|nr:hypothetical protein [Pyrinomonadaceae bacterium]